MNIIRGTLDRAGQREVLELSKYVMSCSKKIYVTFECDQDERITIEQEMNQDNQNKIQGYISDAMKTFSDRVYDLGKEHYAFIVTARIDRMDVRVASQSIFLPPRRGSGH